MLLSRLNQILPAMLLLAVGLAGCVPAVSVRPPAATELDQIKSGQLAVALFQIRTVIDGKAVSSRDAGDANTSPRIYLASLSDLNAPGPVQATSPSEAAAAQGWRYLLLAPGTYHLLVLPPGVEQNPPAVAFHAPSARFGRLTQYEFVPGRGGFWSLELAAFVLAGTPPQGFRELPGFWFQVAGGKPVTYLGTLSAVCRSGRGLLGNLIDSCSDYEVTVDPQAAQQVAAALLQGPVHTATLARYGKPRDGVPLRERGPIAVAMPSSAALGAAYTGAEMRSWGVIHGTGQVIGVYNLLAIAGEGIARAGAELEAKQRAAQAQPCMELLSKAVRAADYAPLFIASFTEAARARGAVIDAGSEQELATAGRGRLARQKLLITAPILRLRESGQPQSLALELGLHLQLEASETRSVVYDSLLLYAEGYPAQNPLAQRSRLYERLVPERAQPRPMAEWCGPDGAALLREEIGAGLKHIAAQLARDLE